MKRKWTLLFLVIIAFAGIFIGCEKSKSTKEEVYKNFQQNILKIKYYKCKADLEVIGNKKSHRYSFIHEYNGSRNFKLIVLTPNHLKGKSIEYTKDKIIVENPKVKDKIILPNVGKDGQHLFIGDFLENYLQGENLEVGMKGNYLTLTVSIPGNARYFSKQILYIDSKNNYPTKLDILDKEGKTRFIVNYSDFRYKK